MAEEKKFADEVMSDAKLDNVAGGNSLNRELATGKVINSDNKPNEIPSVSNGIGGFNNQTKYGSWWSRFRGFDSFGL